MTRKHTESGKLEMGWQAALRQSVPLRLGALCAVLAALPGCQSIDVNSPNVAQIRFVAASPDAPGLDFYANSTGLVYNEGFGSSSSYVPVSPGNYTISVDGHNTTQALVSSTASLGTAKQYTALVGNVAASLQETILQDLGTAAPSGEISVRFLDQATHVGAIDVYLIPSGGKLTTTSPVLTNINFDSNSGYINIPVGTYAIAVVPTGTVPVSTTVTLLNGPQVGYSAGAVRTVVFIDQQITTTPGVNYILLDDYDSPSS